jgi:uncharacterized protein with NAD-binding domain and iron-sulfur cluster
LSARPRVAILGGGMAGMATAWRLSEPGWRDRFDAITVYQRGWRLGGKGASSRGVNGRIEEHGLHIWLGYYENAFRLLRECYAELDRPTRDPTARIQTWTDAIIPASQVGLEEHRGGSWHHWMGDFRPNDQVPGEPDAPGGVMTVVELVQRALGLLVDFTSSLPGAAASGGVTMSASAQPQASSVAAPPSPLATGLGIAAVAVLLEAASIGSQVVGGRGSAGSAVAAVDRALSTVREGLAEVTSSDPGLQRTWHLLSVTLAIIRGVLAEGLLTDPRGFNAINDTEFRTWIAKHGCAPEACQSTLILGLYDLVFGHRDGDPDDRGFGAGLGVFLSSKTFLDYKGAIFWKMTAGMGDVVFAPLYEVLRARGVRFRFFHRLERVRLSEPSAVGETPHVAALELDVQAQVARDEYAPLVDVGGLPCWPAAPDWTQLVDGDRLAAEARAFESHADRRRVATTTLRVGHDFDFVVLGTGLGEIPRVAQELVARDARWRAMVDHVGTVATQAFQVWLGTDVGALGWPHPGVTLSGFVEPFDTWADMTHLVPFEAWPVPPGHIGYFCSVLPGGLGLDPVAQHEIVRRNAIAFLQRDVGRLWPGAATADGDFRWDLLVVPPGVSAPPTAERFATQFWTANVHPSDRYTLTLPGSSAYRISPLDGTWDNLTICGDWTDCGFNAGCVEAAVMSGRLASHAISRLPALEDIVGFDHP